MLSGNTQELKHKYAEDDTTVAILWAGAWSDGRLGFHRYEKFGEPKGIGKSHVCRMGRFKRSRDGSVVDDAE